MVQGLVGRTNLKSVPMLGVEPVNHSVQHRSHIQKFIAFHWFISIDNDLAKGGTAGTLTSTRAGATLPAKKDSYKRE